MPRLRPHANAIERIARVLTLLSLCATLCSAQCQVSFSSPEDHELVSTEALVINFIAVNPSEHGYAIVNATCGDPPRPVFSAQVLQKDLGKLPSPFQVVVPDDSAMSCKGDHLNVTACYYGDAPCQACSSLVLDVSGDGVSIAYVVCSSMSMAGCLVLIFLYIRYPVLRKFPSNLVFWRTVVDLIFSIQFIWINGWEIDNASSPQYCNGGVAFITQFSGAASLGWYLVMALNFYFSVDNPFVRPQTKVAHYHVGVWSASIITGIIASFQYGYRSDFRLCWIKKTSGINLFNWLLYFVWLIIFAVVSIYILWSGSRKLNANTGFAKNLAKTLAKRETALRQTQIYIFVFSFYWTIAAIIWAVVYFISQASDAHEIQQKPLAYFFTIIISVLGLIDVATWLFIQWEPLQKAREQSNQQKSSSDRLDEPADEEFSDISDALRHEFISCTSHGISFTATHPYRPTARPKSLLVPGPESTHAHDGGTGGYVPPGADATKRGGRHSDAYMPVSEDRSAKYVKLLAEEEQVIDLNIKTTEDDSANYKFIAYAPRLFENIRELFKLRSGQEYADSLGGDAREMKKNFSEGASGSFFYRTADDKFMVKTLTETEFQFLLEILLRYQAHFQQFPESLICKFFGLYSIEMYGHREYFAVMGNVLCSPEYPIDEKYDLKGSSVNRHGKSKKKGGNVSVYKDNDIKKYVRISPTDAQRIVRQLEIDSKFMSSINIMDYSLLLGIHNCTESRVPSSHCNGLSAEEKLRRHNPTLADASPARLKSNTSVSALGYPIPADIHGARYGGGYQTPTHWQSSASPPNPAPVPQDLPAPVPLQRVGADGVAPERQPLLESAGDDCKRPDYESNRFNSSVLSRQASPSSASEVSVITDSFPSVMAASVIVGPGIYHMGVIDMLQQWDWKKKLELYTKIILQCHCRDWQWISAVEPSLYQERFIRKMKKVFNIAQDPQHKEQGLL